TVPEQVLNGFETAYGATWAEPDPARPAIAENWIKAYPCCLQTHSSIEAAEQARASGARAVEVMVRVHPISLQAAPYGVPADELEGKFSIPYTVALTVLHGPPAVDDFRALDPDAARLASRIQVRPDPSLIESEAVLEADRRAFRVEAARGSPARPMN